MMASASGRESVAPSCNLESKSNVAFLCLGAGFRYPCPFPVTQVNFSVLRSLNSNICAKSIVAQVRCPARPGPSKRQNLQ